MKKHSVGGREGEGGGAAKVADWLWNIVESASCTHDVLGITRTLITLN